MDFDQFLDQPRFGFYINGKFITPSNRKEAVFKSPTTNKAWKKLAQANAKDTEEAIQAAETAFGEWKKIPLPKRSQLLRKVAELMLEHQDQLAWLMAMEMGKPIDQGKGEVAYAAGYFNWYAGEAERIYGQTIPSQFAEKKLMILYEPVGVCALITPWNFPLAIPARKVAGALAAGCTVVAKPSAESPLSFLALAKICELAGIPKGVVNVVQGPEKVVGDALLSSPIVKKLSFTGSTEVGKMLYQKAAATLKKVTLELGGMAPLLVFDDANIDLAVRETIKSKFRNNGQTCVCANRVYVQKGIYKKFVSTLVKEIKKLRIGDALKENIDLSKILHPASVVKINKHIKDALKKSAKAELLGKEPHEPTVLSGVSEDMLLFQEETFGPVLGICSFETLEEGLKLANDSEYGLASYVFTESLSRANTLIDGLDHGIVGVNDGIPSTYQASFGGRKSSGFGREGGPTGIFEYLQEKYVSIGS